MGLSAAINCFSCLPKYFIPYDIFILFLTWVSSKASLTDTLMSLVAPKMSACFYPLKNGFVLLCFKSYILKAVSVDNIDTNQRFVVWQWLLNHNCLNFRCMKNGQIYIHILSFSFWSKNFKSRYYHQKLFPTLEKCKQSCAVCKVYYGRKICSGLKKAVN